MNEPDTKRAAHRAFFALWPDDATRAALVRASRALVAASGGRAVPAENLHVTLAFLGELGEDEFEAVHRVTAPKVGPFELTIDRTGFRKRAQLLWAAPRDVLPALIALEAGLWERLEEIGIERERRAYLPHVTLARKARRAAGEFSPVRWPVTEMALVESTLGPPNSTYSVARTWSLSRRDSG
ncbi:MAG TPA: RNA 2',3'-cyclic phosphodiesterase [Gammaproteobacteria bacterium]